MATATQVRERPIIFTGESVRAILAGTKTQTRRVIKPQPTFDIAPGRWNVTWKGVTQHNFGGRAVPPSHLMDGALDWLVRNSPYQAGDHLWVREKWRSPSKYIVGYEADAQCGAWMGNGGGGRIWMHHGYMIECDAYRDAKPPIRTFSVKAYGDKWRSPIHMPRWASRITLEIESVKVERCSQISEADAQAEGVERLELSPREIPGLGRVHPMTSSYRDAFKAAWNAIHGPGAWDKNDWIWAITFRRVSP